MLGAAVGAAASFAGRQIDIETELRGDHDLVADRLERLSDQFLIEEWTVGLRSVEQRDAAFMRGTD